MTTVSLLVTGVLEERALKRALERVFPEVTFEMCPRTDGFTASRLPAEPALRNGRTRYVDRVAQKLVAEAFPGRHGTAPDFVFAVDDLELANVDQPEVVVHHLRTAVREHIETQFQAARDRAFAAVAERLSFHLLCPMVESYFFGDDGSLARAGACRTSRFDRLACDMEDFAVDDPDYLRPPHVTSKGDWRHPDRSRHPKRYVKFLTDPSSDGHYTYREADGGVAALRDLEWASVLERPDRARFLRSLFCDLAAALAVPDPFPGDCHPVTWPPRQGRLLRNL